MSLEQRVERLESQFDSLDSSVRSLIKITGETHQIIQENQRENRIKFDQQDRKIEALNEKAEATRRDLTALTAATYAGFKRTDEQHSEVLTQFKQLELLIRQQHADN